MPAPPEAPAQPAEVDADFATLVATMGCHTLRSLASGGPFPAAMSAAHQHGELNRRHLPALLAITFGGPLSVSDLASRLGLGLPTTSTLVGELSRAGLIDRSECPTDRRRTIVCLDEAHRETIASWAFEALAPLSRTLARLQPAARANFIEGWQILNQEAHSDPR
jgi:DNA-binding MarR family transcriptional regulator